MKVLILGNYKYDAQESMQRFAALLMDELRSRGIEAMVITPKPYLGRLSPSRTGIGKWLGYFDKFVIFPWRLRSQARWADVVHICDHGNSLYVGSLKRVPHIVSCHDLLGIKSAMGDVAENRTKWTGRIFQRLIVRGLRMANHIVCVSDTTKRELLDNIPMDSEKVTVSHNALNYNYRPMEISEADKYLNELGLPIDAPYFIHVGGNQWYKNRLGVLSIFRHMASKCDHQLYMIGKPFTNEMRNYVRDHDLSNRVVEITEAGNEELRALYSKATALIFPSLEEGFGWPIIEAQACGCLVITTDRAPMTEVGGSAAVYIDPRDPEGAAKTILANLERTEVHREAGILNCTRFSADNMISKYIQAYQRVCQR